MGIIFINSFFFFIIIIFFSFLCIEAPKKGTKGIGPYTNGQGVYIIRDIYSIHSTSQETSSKYHLGVAQKKNRLIIFFQPFHWPNSFNRKSYPMSI